MDFCPNCYHLRSDDNCFNDCNKKMKNKHKPVCWWCKSYMRMKECCSQEDLGNRREWNDCCGVWELKKNYIKEGRGRFTLLDVMVIESNFEEWVSGFIN